MMNGMALAPVLRFPGGARKSEAQSDETGDGEDDELAAVRGRS